MKNIEFHQLTDRLMLDIEEKLDNFSGNTYIDYEIHSGIMTLSFENKSKIIINRQESLQQIWLASRTHGYRFNFHNGIWLCDRSGQIFYKLLSEVVSLQAGESIAFSSH